MHVAWPHAITWIFTERTSDGSTWNWSLPEAVTSFNADAVHGRPTSCSIAYDDNGDAYLAFVGDVGVRNVFYTPLLPLFESVTKRYYAGGQLLATRVDGTLYYALNDQTGTSFTVTDDTGGFVGRIVYDGYGAELVNTLPAVLGQTLPGAPDAATGLVHQGNGRYYDPNLGRPLQPNLASTPPTVPQSLNRYTATTMGQPGVYAAAETKWNPFADDFISNPFKAVVSNSAPKIYAEASLRRATSFYGEVIEQRLPKRQFIDNALTQFNGAIIRIPERMRGPFNRLSGFIYDANSRYVIEEAEGTITLSWHYLPAGRTLEKWLAGAKSEIVLDGVVGFGIDVGYQVLLDINNPYLTGEQIFKRAFYGQGSGSLVSFGVGLLAKRGTTAWLGTAVGGPVGFVASVGASIIWDIWVAPWIYEQTDAVPTRDLAVLRP